MTLLAAAKKERVVADLGPDRAPVQADFAVLRQLHDHLHELAQTAQPQGLHSFGKAPEELHRLGTVLLMLGQPFWDAAAIHAGVPPEDADEALVGPWEQLARTAPYQLLQRHVVQGEPVDGLPEALQKSLRPSRTAYANLGAQAAGLLAVLDGGLHLLRRRPSKTRCPGATSTALTPRACPPDREGPQTAAKT